ncbi:MAG: DUF3090 domain-containing protein [Actinomycetota bacterium]|nr:DUF3090 domain-containing protein [Actinomycetota bacterium]
MPVHDFDPPSRFVVGTVGPPGQRTFFLQASEGRRLVSLSCEKEQVAILADKVGDLLDQFTSVSADPSGPEDLEPLSTPIEDEFRISTMSLAWDPAREVVVIEAFDSDPTQAEDLEADAPDALEVAPDRLAVRVVLTPEQARAFARRATSLVTAGRPPCPFCGQPLDVNGHVCPRSNGYKR